MQRMMVPSFMSPSRFECLRHFCKGDIQGERRGVSCPQIRGSLVVWGMREWSPYNIPKEFLEIQEDQVEDHGLSTIEDES